MLSKIQVTVQKPKDMRAPPTENGFCDKVELSPRFRMRQLARTDVESQGTKLKVLWAVEA